MQAYLNKNFWETWLVRLLQFGLAATLFLPLLVLGEYFFPYIVPRNLFFRFWLEILLLLYACLLVINKSYRPAKSKVLAALSLYLGVLVLSSFTGINAWKSWWGDFERMGGVWYSLHLFVYFWLAAAVFKTEKAWQTLLQWSLWISLLMSVVGFSQYFNGDLIVVSSGGERLTGTTGNAIYLAGYLLFHLFVILYFLFQRSAFNARHWLYYWLGTDVLLVIQEFLAHASGQEGGWLSQIFNTPALANFFLLLHLFLALWFWQRRRVWAHYCLLGALFIFEFFIFFQTQTRGALVGLAAAVLLAAWLLALVSPRRCLKIASWAVVAAALLLPFVIYQARDTQLIKSVPTLRKLAAISTSDITTQSRLLTWQASWQGVLARPVLGYGPENYYYVFNQRFPTAIFRDAGSQIWFDHAHNIIFDIAVSSGLAGLLAYLLIYLAIFYAAWQYYRQQHKLIAPVLISAAAVAFFLQDFFVFDQLNTDLFWYLLLALAVYLETAATPKTEEAKIKTSGWPWQSLIVVIPLLFLLQFQVNFKVWQANRDLYQAFMEKQSGKFSQTAANYFRSSIDQNTTGRFEARQNFANYVAEVYAGGWLSGKDLQDLVEEATADLEDSIKEEPLNARHYLILGNFINLTPRISLDRLLRGLEVLQQAVQLSPTRPQIYFELGQTLFILGKPAEGLAAFKQGATLAPWTTEANWNWLLAAIYTKQSSDFAAASEALNKLQPDFLQQAEVMAKIASAYAASQQFEPALLWYKKIIAQYPDQLQVYLEILRVAKQAGQAQEITATLAKIKNVAPELLNQAQTILQTATKP